MSIKYFQITIRQTTDSYDMIVQIKEFYIEFYLFFKVGSKVALRTV